MDWFLSDNNLHQERVKDKKLFISVINLSAKDKQKLAKLLSKRIEQSVYYLNEYKTKSQSKNTTSKYKYKGTKL